MELKLEENEKTLKWEALPKRVPIQYFTEEQAESLGYKKKEDLEYVISKLESNQQMFIFSTSNIKKDKDRKFLALRLEGFVLRIRYMLYQTMIVALC